MHLTNDPEVYRTVLDHVASGVCLVDRDGKILLWNAGAERITGFLRQDIVGHHAQENFLGLVDSENNEIPADRLPLPSVLREGRADDVQLSLKHKSGHRVLVRLHAAPLRNEQGKLLGAVGSFSEWTSAGNLEERQNKLAAYGCLDPASGVLNHGILQSHLRETLVTFEEHKVPFSILCIGIDRLSETEHRYGGGGVAAMIRAAGEALEANLRPTDFIGRWGENEFVAILAECGGDEVSLAGERLRKMVLRERVTWWGDLLQITISIGATHAVAGDTVEALLARAEHGLQESIAQGGNRLTTWNQAR